MSLTFGYSTLSSRLGNIKLPDYKSKNWDVLITVQSGNESEPDLSKAPAGVRVLGFPGRGVTKLRNKVIENSNTDYLIFSDDDVEFEILHRGIEIFLDRSRGAMDLIHEEHPALT